MTGLRLADDLTLPIEAVTETWAILARRGRGKTYTGAVMTEEMVRAGQPVVVVDPVGVWWGLRASADGEAAGLPVAILGGSHGDLPLTPTGGAAVADLVVEQRVSCVLDMSGFASKADEIRFMTDFLTRLYRNNREPLHVMFDEADEYAPQQAFPEGKRLLGAMEQVVRRGRARGLGCTLITQRPAVLNKNVLSQVDALVVLGMTGINDLKAVDDWVGKHADGDQASDVKASLPALPVGHAWVWAPATTGLQRIQVRARETFDSSATPKVGTKRVTPRVVADVDLDALREAMTEAEETSEAVTPSIARLQRTIAQLQARPPERIEVQVPSISPEQHEQIQAALRGAVNAVEKAATTIRESLAQVKIPQVPVVNTPEPAPTRPRDPAPWEIGRGAAPASGETLPKAQRAILTVLAQHGRSERSFVALVSGYAVSGGGFRNAMSALRTSDRIEGTDPVAITATGMEALGHVEPLPTGWALIDRYSNRIGRAHRLILDALRPRWPEGLDTDSLAATAGYEPTGGGFRNALSRLRSLRLVHTENGITRLADILMED